jgi:hypothetical protein
MNHEHKALMFMERNNLQPSEFSSFPPRGKAGMGAIKKAEDLVFARPHPDPPPAGEGTIAYSSFG